MKGAADFSSFLQPCTLFIRAALFSKPPPPRLPRRFPRSRQASLKTVARFSATSETKGGIIIHLPRTGARPIICRQSQEQQQTALGACPRNQEGSRAWGLRGEFKAQGGGDVDTSSSTSNAEIARNSHAPGTRLLLALGQAPRFQLCGGEIRHRKPGASNKASREGTWHARIGERYRPHFWWWPFLPRVGGSRPRNRFRHRRIFSR